MNTIRSIQYLILFFITMGLSGCASLWFGTPIGDHHASSVVNYLYPTAQQSPQEDTTATITHLQLPIRVGIAFVPSSDNTHLSLSEESKMVLMEQVKDKFKAYPFISKIDLIPTAYLRSQGGFENLDQVTRMFGVDVMALVSYDQMQFNDANKLSLTYWTIVGAYLFKGDQYDTQTLVDVAVYDVASRKLLFRAPGTSTIKGSSTMINYKEEARTAQLQGFGIAVSDMIPRLDHELATFKERVKTDTTVQVTNREGFSSTGGGSMDGWIAPLALAAWFSLRRRSATTA